VGEAHRKGIGGSTRCADLRWDDAGHRVHPRPGGGPKILQYRPRPGARPRSAARLRRLRSLTRQSSALAGALPLAVGGVCLRGGVARADYTPWRCHPRPARWGARRMSGPARSL